MSENQPEKAKVTRGITATLPDHVKDEMREANRDMGMALDVVRGIVDAAVAEALPPGKVTELVVARRRKDDEAALKRRKAAPGTVGEIFGLLERQPQGEVTGTVTLKSYEEAMATNGEHYAGNNDPGGSL